MVLLLASEPESTRMPAVADVVVTGAATVLLLILVLRVQVDAPKLWFRQIDWLPGIEERITARQLRVARSTDGPASRLA